MYYGAQELAEEYCMLIVDPFLKGTKTSPKVKPWAKAFH